ncbi:lipopolysaccharide biosynthesis protein [Priestia megaterium]|uniref:lipopolysaccharide biosynthesis protein n=1 Tax=Priestia megaterium TaxID=1404 RepID=UPI002E1D7215|nr:polysaccharide biosynthesis C-terminal domain-containing protein [Priestia megaterium]
MKKVKEELIYKKTLIHYIPAVLIPAITNIFLTLGLARILSIELYGEYTYYTSLGVLITSILSQWLVQSIQKFNYSDKDKKEYVFMIIFVKKIYIYSFCLSMMGWICLVFFIGRTDNIASIICSVVMLFTSQSLLAVQVAQYAAEYYVKNIKAINMQQSFYKLISVSLYLILIDNYQLNEIITVISVSNFLNLMLFIQCKEGIKTLFTNKNKKMENFSAQLSMQFKKFILYGLPMTGWFIGSNLLGVGDRIILKIFTDSSKVGIYSANYTLVSMGIGLLVSPLLQAAHPVIMNFGQENKGSDKKISNFIEQLSRKYLAIGLFIVVFLSIYYKKISLLLFGPEYQEGALIIPLTIVGIFLWNYSMYGHKGIELIGKPLKMMKYVIYSAVINLGLNFILVPYLGINGSGIATLVAYSSYAILIKLDSKKNIKWIINYKLILSLLIIYSLALWAISPLVNRILNLAISLTKT